MNYYSLNFLKVVTSKKDYFFKAGLFPFLVKIGDKYSANYSVGKRKGSFTILLQMVRQQTFRYPNLNCIPNSITYKQQMMQANVLLHNFHLQHELMHL